MRPPRGGGSFRGRDGGRGGARGGRFGGRGGGGRGRGGGYDEGPPSEVVEISTFLHACEGDAVTKLTNEKIPYFNASIYLENKTQIGKVDEIFGPINESLFSIKMLEGIIANSYSPGDKFFIDPAKLLPLARFLPRPKVDILWGKRQLQEVDVVEAFVEGVEVAEVDAAEAFVEEVPLGVVEGDHLEGGGVASEAVEDHSVMHALIICIWCTPSICLKLYALGLV
ncbi:hypothetical protein ZIOFF_007362 [Zingiber officinale]|uniref:H/ACA ribonucleoprotein complex subunit n=1 Tax=Zingiber officinale TaxID=94328 RepID=A0A8J5IDK4_ZINOF|nr:hypothetical protein ZIOFF_007362 [Zingiber officinale]